VTWPTPPPELVYALRVSVADLRPWEYAAMEADRYDEIVELRQIWQDERAYWRRQLSAEDEHGK